MNGREKSGKLRGRQSGWYFVLHIICGRLTENLQQQQEKNADSQTLQL